MHVIRDDQGRARIGVDESQPCPVVLLDHEGHIVASLQLDRDGRAVVCWLHGEDEKIAAERITAAAEAMERAAGAMHAGPTRRGPLDDR